MFYCGEKHQGPKQGKKGRGLQKEDVPQEPANRHCAGVLGEHLLLGAGREPRVLAAPATALSLHSKTSALWTPHGLTHGGER